MKLLFEQSIPGRGSEMLPPLDVPAASLPERHRRTSPLRLPEMAQGDISRHYSALSRRAHGVNSGFYPLGSCTMKYNPKINDEMASLPGFTDVHPLQPAETAQGCLEVLAESEKLLCEITGMDAMTFQPAAGAHGELTGILLIKAWHAANGGGNRTKIIVPDSAHGTNPATASMAGYQVVNIPSGPDGCVDLAALRAAVGEDTAGIMLTNPNTLGIFEKDILAITEAVHGAGGLCYYDGANLNAVMGVVRPGDMGFDVVHLNIHKTFSTPHGGGGPGCGAVGCKALLADYLPKDHPVLTENGYTFEQPVHSIGRVKVFYGNFLVMVRALTYLLTLGREGIREAAENAVLNANYMMEQLRGTYHIACPGHCMHEFVMGLGDFKKETGISAADVSKALLDEGIHPPTMYFPLIVPEALMIEPTETESRETMDNCIQVLREIAEKAKTNPDALHEAPVKTPIRRLDEVQAARSPKLRYIFE